MQHNQGSDIYGLVLAKAKELESKLRSLNRWQPHPLPAEKYENMGAFGSNTMSFEQWLQFVLIPRILEIIRDNAEFPSGSMLAAYAVREFDGDNEAEELNQILSDIDEIINGSDPDKEVPALNEILSESETITVGDVTIPKVLYILAEALPQLDDGDLESQLQTFDTFLEILDPSTRKQVADLLYQTSARTTKIKKKLRIQAAASAISSGRRATDRYDHGEAMRRYEEQHKKDFPNI